VEKYYGKGDNVGGIVGNCVNGIIINSNYNIGAINGEKNIIGGIAGTVQKKCEITNNYNVSNIRGNDNSNYLAGIIGFSDSSLVKNCYNIGNIKVEPEYEPYITGFYSFIPMSKGQPMKGTICSYKDTLVFTFSSILADTMIQRSFFKKLVNDGVEVTIETNGEYYD